MKYLWNIILFLTFHWFYLLATFCFSFCVILVSAHTGCVCSGDLSVCGCLCSSNWWELQCVVQKRLALFTVLHQTAAPLAFFLNFLHSLQTVLAQYWAGNMHIYFRWSHYTTDQMETRLKLMNRLKESILPLKKKNSPSVQKVHKSESET